MIVLDHTQTQSSRLNYFMRLPCNSLRVFIKVITEFVKKNTFNSLSLFYITCSFYGELI